MLNRPGRTGVYGKSKPRTVLTARYPRTPRPWVGKVLILGNPSVIKSRLPAGPKPGLTCINPGRHGPGDFRNRAPSSMRPQPRFVAVHDGLDQPPHAGVLRGAVVAMGNFEGVHRGHRAVIAAAVARGRALGRP